MDVATIIGFLTSHVLVLLAMKEPLVASGAGPVDDSEFEPTQRSPRKKGQATSQDGQLYMSRGNIL